MLLTGLAKSSSGSKTNGSAAASAKKSSSSSTTSSTSSSSKEPKQGAKVDVKEPKQQQGVKVESEKDKDKDQKVIPKLRLSVSLSPITAASCDITESNIVDGPRRGSKDAGRGGASGPRHVSVLELKRTGTTMLPSIFL
jgi:hypothetical protein